MPVYRQYNGGFLPEIILSTLDYVITLGNPFHTMYSVEFLSLQSMFLPKPFDCSGGLAAFSFFHNICRHVPKERLLGRTPINDRGGEGWA